MPTWIQDILSDPLLPDKTHVVRLTAAIILGGIIGLERELRDKPAGFRTIVLICLGACMFTILSQVVGGPDWNSTRIAAQIVTGIGFLGAGAILRDRRAVFGMTTAATIWAVAAIGMAAGFGHLGLAVAGTIAILAALLALDVIEHWIGDRRDIQRYRIISANTDDTLSRIIDMFDSAKLKTRKRTCHEDGESLVVDVIAMGSKVNHEQLRLRFTRSEEYTLLKS